MAVRVSRCSIQAVGRVVAKNRAPDPVDATQVVLPLGILAIGFLVHEAMSLDGSESDAPVVAGVKSRQ